MTKCHDLNQSVGLVDSMETDKTGNTVIGTTRSGKNIITGKGAKVEPKIDTDTRIKNLEATIENLQIKVSELERRLAIEEAKDKIIVVGGIDDSSKVPVQVNGRIKKIALT